MASEWYYVEGRDSRGPFAESEFAALVRAGTVRADTLVWSPDMPDWAAAEAALPPALRDSTWGGPPPVPPTASRGAVPRIGSTQGAGLGRGFGSSGEGGATLADRAAASPRAGSAAQPAGDHPTGFVESVRAVFGKYATFRGRARRPEFWWFMLFSVLGSLVAGALDAAMFGTSSAEETGPVGSVFSLAIFLPTLAVTARRLHDTGRTGWWQVAPVVGLVVMLVGAWGYFMSGAPAEAEAVPIAFIVGGLLGVGLAIALLVFLVQRGDEGPNRYGPA